MTHAQQLKAAQDEADMWRDRAIQNRKLIITAVEALVAAHEALDEERAELKRAIKELRS